MGPGRTTRPAAALALALTLVALPVPAYDGSSWREIRAAVFSDPYAELPYYEVDTDFFGESGDGADNHLRAAARRTLTVRDDLVDFPGGRKLIQPNGICFGGHWRITAPSDYSGLFSEGTHALAIARASVALGDTEQGDRRAFSFAVKLFPTQDPEVVVPTANLFAMETLVGTDHPHFLDAVMDNHPQQGGLPSLAQLGIGLRMRSDLRAVDGELSPTGPKLRYRPVTNVAASGIEPGTVVSEPRWVRLRIAEGTPRVDAGDFRDELRLDNYPGGRLTWEIDVAAEHVDGKEHADWRHIGRLVLDESVVSKSCDARLHFAHPLVVQEY